MPDKQHGPGITHPDVYEELRDGVARRGGRAEPYEEWTVSELRKRAAEIGIEGRSYMKKARLISALRKH